jgi:predicted CoA-binding protein
MPIEADDEIAAILRRVKTIALLGASERETRPSYRTMQFLLAKGYRVYPVNPALAGGSISGIPVVVRLADIPGRVDMVDVFRRAEHLPGIVTDCIDAGINVLWTQLGVVHAAALQRAEANGMQVVADRCPMIEWPRLARAGLLN